MTHQHMSHLLPVHTILCIYHYDSLIMIHPCGGSLDLAVRDLNVDKKTFDALRQCIESGLM